MKECVNDPHIKCRQCRKAHPGRSEKECKKWHKKDEDSSSVSSEGELVPQGPFKGVTPQGIVHRRF